MYSKFTNPLFLSLSLSVSDCSHCARCSFYGNEDGRSFREGNWIVGEIKIGLTSWKKKKKKKKSRFWFHGNYRGHVDETLLKRVCPLRERSVSSKEETFSRILSQLWKIGPRIEWEKNVGEKKVWRKNRVEIRVRGGQMVQLGGSSYGKGRSVGGSELI